MHGENFMEIYGNPRECAARWLCIDVFSTKNTVQNECQLKFWQSYGHLKIASLYGDCMKPGYIGKSNTNNLPAPTDLT
jgi:hypothetical protein